MMAEVFVVYYDEYCPGYGDSSPSEQRRIDCVVDSIEKAHAKINDMYKRPHVNYADFKSFKVE
jgi:hypothetical protein